ncbi:hypothetical protein CQW23_06014 [Capsicum baccatum]|uniref:Uncharacterized protein n=1 Tax=Capsicum baccatum TaxID=33114 RepID=A0A2G2X232_CAPBA|nr:hypothetical protein CQW23_06014 [Capsicum baccatum]
MGRVFRCTYGQPFGCLGDTNKEKTIVFNIPLNKKPILTKGGNKIIYLLYSFLLIPLDNKAVLPSNKWLRVSKQPWHLGRRFVVHLLFGSAVVWHLNPKIQSNPIRFSPIQPKPRT